MTPPESSEWWFQVIPELGASLTVINYALKVINYAPREHLQYRCHSWRSLYDDQNIFIIQATCRGYANMGSILTLRYKSYKTLLKKKTFFPKSLAIIYVKWLMWLWLFPIVSAIPPAYNVWYGISKGWGKSYD